MPIGASTRSFCEGRRRYTRVGRRRWLPRPRLYDDPRRRSAPGRLASRPREKTLDRRAPPRRGRREQRPSLERHAHMHTHSCTVRHAQYSHGRHSQYYSTARTRHGHRRHGHTARTKGTLSRGQEGEIHRLGRARRGGLRRATAAIYTKVNDFTTTPPAP